MHQSSHSSDQALAMTTNTGQTNMNNLKEGCCMQLAKRLGAQREHDGIWQSIRSANGGTNGSRRRHKGHSRNPMQFYIGRARSNCCAIPAIAPKLYRTETVYRPEVLYGVWRSLMTEASHIATGKKSCLALLSNLSTIDLRCRHITDRANRPISTPQAHTVLHRI